MDIASLIMVFALESPKFETRQNAEQALRAQGITALPYLKLAEQSVESLEAKRRLSRLYDETYSQYINNWLNSKQWEHVNRIAGLSESDVYFERAKWNYMLRNGITEEAMSECCYEGGSDVWEEIGTDATRMLAQQMAMNGTPLAEIEKFLAKKSN